MLMRRLAALALAGVLALYSWRGVAKSRRSRGVPLPKAPKLRLFTPLPMTPAGRCPWRASPSGWWR